MEWEKIINLSSCPSQPCVRNRHTFGSRNLVLVVDNRFNSDSQHTILLPAITVMINEVIDRRSDI